MSYLWKVNTCGSYDFSEFGMHFVLILCKHKSDQLICNQ